VANDDDWRLEWASKRGRFGDSGDVSLQRPALARWLWASAGVVALGLGLLGAFLPVLPTTPFMIVAAWCFAKSSRRLYNYILSNGVFGPLVYRWQTSGSIPVKAKIAAVGLIIVTFTLTLVFAVTAPIPRVILVVIGVSVSAWLITRPSSS